MRAKKTLEWTDPIILNKARARFIRILRGESGAKGSWRCVAEVCHEAFNGTWEPKGNQAVGYDLCRAAAKCLGEDPDGFPWN